MKIGILYIATGRYIVFWEDFYKSSQKFLLNNAEKHYFVFTDCQTDIVGQETGFVHKIYQEKLGWPYDTLMRFDIFLKAEDALKKMDYIYFFNANIEFITPISTEILPQKEHLVGVKHPDFYGRNREEFPYEINQKSTAYIALSQGIHYFMGGFNGGKAIHYLQLIHSLSNRIKTDLENNIIALWHDESQLNRYYIDKENEVLILDESYATPQINKRNIPNPKSIIRDKSHYKYGGHNYLRGKTNRKYTKLEWTLDNFYKNLKKKIRKFFKISKK